MATATMQTGVRIRNLNSGKIRKLDKETVKKRVDQYAGYKIKKNGKEIWTFKGYENYEVDREAALDMIRKAYNKAGWTHRTFALWSGISQATVWKIINAHSRYPRLDTLWRMSEGLGLKFTIRG